MIPDQTILDELVRRTVEAVHPLRIILFGSAARGAMGPHSDLDVLVVMPDGCDRRAAIRIIRRNLRGLGCAKDVVVILQSDVDQCRTNPWMIVHTALAEGRELYRVAS